MDGVTAIAVIVIASFAIDRIATGSLFLLSFIKPWTRFFPDPATIKDDGGRSKTKAALILPAGVQATTVRKRDIDRPTAEKRLKLAYHVLASILGIGVLAGLGKIWIFTAVGFPVPGILDAIVTGLILVAGADRLAAIIKMPGAPGVEKSEPRPIEITGRLILEGETSDKVASATNASSSHPILAS